MRNDLTTRIEDVENEVKDLSKSVNERLENFDVAPTDYNLRPITPHEDDDKDKKKRVKSAIRRPSVLKNK